MKEFKLPELGENVESGEVVNVLVEKGDVVSPEQPVLELETDKATLEVPVSFGGKIQEIRTKAGDTVEVGQVILVIDGEGPEEPEARKTEAEGTEEEAKEAKAEKKEPAQKRKEKDKEKAPEKARDEGKAEEQRRAEAKEPEKEETEPKEEREPPKDEPRARSGRHEVAPAAPSIRRLARELGVDIDRVEGSGPGDRISEEDVKRHVRSILSSRRPEEAPEGRTAVLPDLEKWGPVERQPLQGIRRKTSEHVARAWTTIPHVTQNDAADVTELEALRKRYATRAEAAGGKLTVTAIALKIAASALNVFPKFATALDAGKEELVYRQYRHLGVAVDTERGLLVPVIRDVDRKNIVELARELSEIADKARKGKLSVDEMRGGVFTITNLGGIGGTSFSPIVNWPEVAILGLSRSTWQPLLDNGAFEPRLQLPLSLSYDHRVIDGAEAARFLRWIAEALESPFLLSLEG